MKGIFICGGIGKRMQPLTKDKALLSFCGKSLIEHHIDSAISAGIDRFLVIGNPNNINELKTIAGSRGDIKIDFAVQEKSTGMAGALLSAESAFDNEPVIIINPNDIFDKSAYSNILNAYETDSHCSVYVTAYKVNEYFPGGYLICGEDNSINGIIEKPPQGSEPSDLINIVIHLHSQPQLLLEYLHKTTSEEDDVYEKAIDGMIRDGRKIAAVVYNGRWQAIKYPWHILNVMDYLLHNESATVAVTARIAESAVIDGPVIIEDNARILEGAVIRGPSYIGRNVIIGNNALVRESHIGERSVVGFNTEIKHSYIGSECWFHSNYIGDSVIEDNCSFGAGAVTANFRLDEMNISVLINKMKIDTGTDKLGAMIGTGARIGINASLMPGVRIGANSFVGPQVCLTGDLGSNKMALCPPNYRTAPVDISKQKINKRNVLYNKLGK